MAGQLGVTIDQGTDRVIALTVKKPDGTPQDLSTIPLRWLAKRDIRDDDSLAVITKDSNGHGVTISIPLDSVVPNLASIAIREADTTAILIPPYAASITLYCGMKSYAPGSHEMLVEHVLQITRSTVQSATPP